MSPVDQAVSQGTRRPWAKGSVYLWEKLNLGASVESVCAILDEWRSQVRAWAGALSHVSLKHAYLRLVEAECRSNYWQLLAAETPTMANKERALRETMMEIAAEQAYADALKSEIMRELNETAPNGPRAA